MLRAFFCIQRHIWWYSVTLDINVIIEICLVHSLELSPSWSHLELDLQILEAWISSKKSWIGAKVRWGSDFIGRIRNKVYKFISTLNQNAIYRDNVFLFLQIWLEKKKEFLLKTWTIFLTWDKEIWQYLQNIFPITGDKKVGNTYKIYSLYRWT